MISASSLYDKDAAKNLYLDLMAINPHLPPMELVTANQELELGFGENMLPTLRLTMFIALPKKDIVEDDILNT